MEFDYDKVKDMLDKASAEMSNTIKKYENIISDLTPNEKNVLLLYFRVKKYFTMTSENFKPKGNWWNREKIRYIEWEEKRIFDIVKELYPDIVSNYFKNQEKGLDAKKIFVIEAVNRMHEDMEGKLMDIVIDFSDELKSSYTKNCPYVFTIISHDVNTLIASPNRENQYLNSVVNGIFACTTMDEIEKYAARSQTHGGMIANRNGLYYPSNPFSGIENDKLVLNHPANVYLSDATKFEPQFDIDIGRDGQVHFLYGGEWISTSPELECIKTQMPYLPVSFIEKQNVYFEEGRDKQTLITKELFDDMKLS